MSSDKQQGMNTDTLLWKNEQEDRVFVTRGGGIGMASGGRVVVRRVTEWVRLVWWQTLTQPDLAIRLEAAGRDDRLATGALYLEAASELRRLEAALVESGRRLAETERWLAVARETHGRELGVANGYVRELQDRLGGKPPLEECPGHPEGHEKSNFPGSWCVHCGKMNL